MTRERGGAPTAFAPAMRVSGEEIELQRGRVASQALLVEALDAVPVALIVINRCRQIVFANRAFLELTGEAAIGGIQGRRFGEALGCAHAGPAAGGCGTAEICRYCGAVNAMLRTIERGEPSVQECRISRSPSGEALDLRVWSTPIAVYGEPLVVFALMDIGAEKRRQALERIFFHDIANTAGGLSGIAEMLTRVEPCRVSELTQMVQVFARQMIDEISAQRELVSAEEGTLAAHVERVDVSALVHGLVDAYRHHPAAERKRIEFAAGAEPLNIATDRALLGRVVGNMLKNAIEATAPEGVVAVACEDRGGAAEVRVHNDGVMPVAVRLQVFQRSFSTKGAGRGLGTYGMRLLTEQYLRGQVGFTSTVEGGTTFRVVCPSLES